MAFDYKKEYKEFYLPPQKPAVVRVPPMNYVAVRGQGNPNDENGEYKRAIGILYAVSYTLKMSKLGKHKLEGYFDYVVPPLEGLWRMNDGKPFDYAHKDDLCWISMIRLPDFVKKADFEWLSRKVLQRRSSTFPPPNFLRLTKSSVSNVCTSGATKANRRQYLQCAHLSKRRAMHSI